jgi:hypothetical protein
MVEDIAGWYKQILDFSYSVYGDISKINVSVSRAGSMLGLQQKQMPTIVQTAAQVVQTVQEIPPEEKKVTAPAVQEEPSMIRAMVPVKQGASSTTTKDTKTQLGPIKRSAGAPGESMEKWAGIPIGMQAPQQVQTENVEGRASRITAMEAGALKSNLPESASEPVETTENIIAAPPEVLKESTESKESRVTSMEATALAAQRREGAAKSPTETSEMANNVASVPPAQKENIESKSSRITLLEEAALASPKQIQEVQAPTVKMEAAISSVSPVSALLNLVRAKGSISIGDAAEALHVDRTLVEKWAKILSQSSLLKIKYQLVGDMVMEA